MRRVLTLIMAMPLMVATIGAAPDSKLITPEVSNRTSQVEPSKFFEKTLNKPYKTNKKLGNPYQTGKASWYGRQFNGRETASGESFNMFNLTAAHRTLPLGTWVKVTNLRNGTSVIVRINDRGPVPTTRIIDLSYEAATQLDLRENGLGQVRLDLVAPESIAMELRAELVN